ncbi:FKBP-type peptidyl-prolyl cis-trans isomerase [Mucilaginibacter sp. AW1-7]|jgi:FKBP-type peptidyl-prolyl cis-trans isomerase|uniref:FKBP-type peptidyl-prolyl cis-trans isomerase n=1 Tax=unclassified Mucilaginibacter TaxID=2617802 RepID=UPI002364FDD1|nr:FKBP-type peptidyl-prolyl cis-trans isomerase [Mucilaginibacter sp. KACC 22773]WDF77458.1 FKBP-type peptidyl-prolyl cis-trans isomerase [Mucilaginibacter sp. KACC 22773]
MKKLLLLLLLPVALFSSCLKSNNNVVPFDAAKQAAADETTIQAYLAAHTEIHAVKDTTGVYYQIITQGTGANPALTTTITAAYTGKLTNGTIFDSSTNLVYRLNGLIPAWQIALPYLKTGGQMLIITPSRYAYGNAQAGIIPANSVLIFSVNLTAVAN